MRLWMVAAMSIAAGLGVGVQARAQSPFYVSGSVGGYFRQSDDVSQVFHHVDQPTSAAPGTNKRDFSPGVEVNAALGYHLTSHIRVEAEFNYTGYTGSAVHPLTSAAGFSELHGQAFDHNSGDDFSRIGGTANAFYDFSPIAALYTPYVGAGVGVVRDHASTGVFTDSVGHIFNTSGGSSTEGLAMVEAGVSIAIAPHLSLVPAYRYVHFFQGDEDVAHVIKVGLMYSF
jgi:opacity protein-like surface antigen